MVGVEPGTHGLQELLGLGLCEGVKKGSEVCPGIGTWDWLVWPKKGREGGHCWYLVEKSGLEVGAPGSADFREPGDT